MGPREEAEKLASGTMEGNRKTSWWDHGRKEKNYQGLV